MATQIKKSAKAGKTKKGPSAVRIKLEKDLKGLVGKINDEGLVFLLKQAHVILHNMQVDMINQDIVDLESSKKRGKPQKAVKEDSRPLAEIKPATDNKSFIIVMNNARKIFSLQEMKSLVAICEAAKSGTDGASRLYSWFTQNRKDVLGDVGIGNARHPLLVVLYDLVKRSYKTGR
jgi:hypothetical protein